MREMLLELYASTTPEVRRRGRRWYPLMRHRLRSLAQEHQRPLSQVAAVLAITSVDAQLAVNLRWTEEILRGEREAGRYPANQAPKVRAALGARYPCRHVTGPKVQAFYRAVMGDPDALVLDRWMLKPVLGHDGRRVPRIQERAQIEQIYRSAAETCGERVAHFQAIIWIALRESTPDRRGRLRNLPDITKGENHGTRHRRKPA